MIGYDNNFVPIEFINQKITRFDIHLIHPLKQQGLCQFIVSHDMTLATRFSDSILTLEDSNFKIKSFEVD
ncbi:hypothetical protein GMA92_09225 [Turicibacter sanguinis]|uniref:Uncharacterized protein n=2 Tax=Turicibacter sanguinis TaxID=154288 RepID=A0A6A8SCR7_9FIRM|nr:hypothetical protein [Turicibacter sanguinis]EFF62803.1 conserved hypothetical protein [Turicibacter sanguinis PC909]EGC91280.1 hypothetical protein HMPREF9402_2021 [Turicibacter sp. HGF1]MCU7191384.1 hypothetical protein [Turicibacter sanguinis]MCU7197509.1 hypothetical protein [Turicibacter sanguinis]MCU7201828.1 hypothetical protein [Turicibacter sanguinis]